MLIQLCGFGLFSEANEIPLWAWRGFSPSDAGLRSREEEEVQTSALGSVREGVGQIINEELIPIFTPNILNPSTVTGFKSVSVKGAVS